MQVKNELAKIRSGSMDFEKQIGDGMKSFDQDIDWLKAMGIGANESEQPGDPAPTSTTAGSVDSGGTYAEPDSGTSGGVVSSQQVYKYLRSKNISHVHALGITANILGESDFRIGADEAGDGSRESVFSNIHSHLESKHSYKQFLTTKPTGKVRLTLLLVKDHHHNILALTSNLQSKQQSGG